MPVVMSVPSLVHITAEAGPPEETQVREREETLAERPVMDGTPVGREGERRGITIRGGI